LTLSQTLVQTATRLWHVIHMPQTIVTLSFLRVMGTSNTCGYVEHLHFFKAQMTFSYEMTGGASANILLISLMSSKSKLLSQACVK